MRRRDFVIGSCACTLNVAASAHPCSSRTALRSFTRRSQPNGCLRRRGHFGSNDFFKSYGEPVSSKVRTCALNVSPPWEARNAMP